jgi:hypothetical protein
VVSVNQKADDNRNDEDFLDELEERMKDGEITRAQVFKRLRTVSDRVDGTKVGDPSRRQTGGLGSYSTFLRLLFVGGLLILAGILWWQWTQLSPLARIASTLGTGGFLFVGAWGTDRWTNREGVVRWLHTTGAVALPVGLVTFFLHLGFDPTAPFTVAGISGILFFLYGLVYWTEGRPLLFLFAIFFGSTLFVGVTDLLWNLLADGIPRVVYYYRTFGLAGVWLILGHNMEKYGSSTVGSLLVGLGSAGLLGAGFLLGQGFSTPAYYWEMTFPVLALFVLWLGVVKNNRVGLLAGALFLLAFLARISLKHFRVEMGLPVALILLGFGTLSIASITYLLYSRLKTS